MFRMGTPSELARWLDEYRRAYVCAYGAGPGRRCDCKFNGKDRDGDIKLPLPPHSHFSEQSGCCEMRAIVDDLYSMESHDGESADQENSSSTTDSAS